MTATSKVRATIITDNTEKKCEIPILLTELGEIVSLTDFILQCHVSGKSTSYLNRLIQSVQLLIAYISANEDAFDNPKVLFSQFVGKLYEGTVDENGSDPSGLYWEPKSRATVNKLVGVLNAYLDYNALNINALVEASAYEKIINDARWLRKNNNTFLSHLKSNSRADNNYKREIKLRSVFKKSSDDAIAFPEIEFPSFFVRGFRNKKDIRQSIRDMLIVYLMHYTGLRISEVLHLWIPDVTTSGINTEAADVKIYHPEFGKAPFNFKSVSKKNNRSSYLIEKFGLTPRTLITGAQQLGWKNRVLDDVKDFYLRATFFPQNAGETFLKLWKAYLPYVAEVSPHHPYAFISFEKNSRGNPYTYSAFFQNYNKAILKFKKTPSKDEGYCPHGHRHAFGRRLVRGLAHPIVIQRLMHHASIEAQIVYTGQSNEYISKALDEASSMLIANQNPLIKADWSSLVEFGFNDIDASGLFSGSNPKFKR